jgi:putative ATP-dependent endonuclease of OLD family
LQTQFVSDDSVKKVNDIISSLVIDGATEKRLKLTIDLSSRDAWESSFLTSVEEIPFHHIGKGEQAVIKTKLALEHKKSKEANILLIEEPENHLSHSKLNQLIKDISDKCIDKQILISTHSSFVANKLGLEKLVIIENKIQLRIKNLKGDTQEFFEKLPGYDTLRLILCKKAILVEGDCDELLVQRAYMDKNKGRLPIEDQIDVISVATSFLRFLQIATKIEKPVCIVTDTDGDVGALELKYAEYLGAKAKTFVKICYDDVIDSGELLLSNKKPFNYNTLEPKFLKSNGTKKLNKILDSNKSEDELHLYMKSNKTSCALKIFETKEQLKFPKYILDAIEK